MQNLKIVDNQAHHGYILPDHAAILARRIKKKYVRVSS